MHVSEYFWYDPFDPDDWAGFQLQSGIYQPMSINAQGQMLCRTLDLVLVRWEGFYKGVEAVWLRWASLAGVLLLTGEEQARQQAEQAQQQVAQIVRNLVQSGMSIAQIAQVTGLTVEQVQDIAREAL